MCERFKEEVSHETHALDGSAKGFVQGRAPLGSAKPPSPWPGGMLTYS